MSKGILFTNTSFCARTLQQANALLVEEGRIGFVGKLEQAREIATGTYEEVDLAGKTILPGLCDFHLHFGYTAEKLDAVDCETDTLDECLRRVAIKAKNTPAGEWIIGYGWNHNVWQPAEYGSAKLLDQVTTAHPILLHAKSLHASWVNTMAMRKAGISHLTPDPGSGVILRDENGSPTGILLENATALISSCIPQPNTEQTAQKLLRAQSHFHSLGLTAVHDFDRFDTAEALLLLAERDELKLRVSKNLPSEEIDKVVEGNWRERLSHPPFLKPGWLKIFADGALGPQSAALLAPYEGTQNQGMLLLSSAELLELGKKAGAAGWPLSVHAIGDRAVREVLDGFALLRQHERDHGYPRLPHRLEHIQLIEPTDLFRMKEQDIIASVQPIHATSDMFTAQHYWGGRCELAYAYQSMIAHQIDVRFGSDAPVETADLFKGLHAAVTRRRADGQPGPQGWYPEQRVSFDQALKAYTQPLPGNDEVDLLQAGMPADMIVLEQDPSRLDPHELADLKPLITVVAGEIVYSR